MKSSFDPKEGKVMKNRYTFLHFDSNVSSAKYIAVIIYEFSRDLKILTGLDTFGENQTD